MPHPERGPRAVDYKALLRAYDRVWQRFHADPTPHTFGLLKTGEDLLIRELLKPGAFELGHLVATPGALVTLEESGHIPPEFLIRHKNGDWGDLPPVDVQENERSLARGGRLFSAYHTRREDRIWVITESDRSATTLLWPEDY